MVVTLHIKYRKPTIINEGLVIFDKEMKVFYKTKQLKVKTPERKLQFRKSLVKKRPLLLMSSDSKTQNRKKGSKRSPPDFWVRLHRNINDGMTS